MNDTYDITGKVALVTGANRGIGKTIVEAFIHGGVSKIYLAVRDVASADALLAQYPEQLVVLEVDIAKQETIFAAAKKANDVDLVVNNAGILLMAMPLDEHVVEALQTQMAVNVNGLLYMAQAFAPVLKSNGGGAFVQLNSIASLRAFPAFSSYAASKAAAYSLTQALREQLAEQGTRVMSVHPGPIATDMAKDAGFGDIAETADTVAKAIIDGLKAGQFHVFPDAMAQEMWVHYQSFARNVVEADSVE
ncbi:SDR family oxidoreductase [Methylophaga nitratireducenticrescens]|uniref:3-oxoacyl-(Acyl-carrier protein) reductase n=1 Tax=Methylophaga nitratireducenticrescens TaxID=754476 RepID=I1XJI3_METNJ|nr:SDR family oxidoreductase [Methylophaga nitratireducenticrescens]AFI84552.1 short-chain dehydrogenase [Methylophaga nitratireducenticrescens]AUZ84574.1 short-chain dehydrogenase [Methylophaga nitratireducenticrescens]